MKVNLIKKILLNWLFLIFWWCLGFYFYVGFITTAYLGLFLFFLNLVLIIFFKITQKYWLFFVTLVMFLLTLIFIFFWPNRYKCSVDAIPALGFRGGMMFIPTCDCRGISWQMYRDFKCYTLR